MKPFLAVAVWLLCAYALRGESFTVRVQETASIEMAGATAAYTTDPLIADVITAAPGLLSVTGHSSGTTQLVVISAGRTQAFLITVAALPLPSAAAPAAGAPLARYDGLYSSGTRRVPKPWLVGISFSATFGSRTRARIFRRMNSVMVALASASTSTSRKLPIQIPKPGSR